MEQIVVFTDLDGTLIDHDTYDFREALPALNELKSRDIPIIICSSKTRAEIEVYRRRMDLDGPFIAENGGAVFVPAGSGVLTNAGFDAKGPYEVLELGLPYADLCSAWREIKREGNFRMQGFSEMTLDEICTHTSLSSEEAALAAKREYSEPFLFSDTSTQFDRLQRLVHERRLKITRGGRFFHLMGQNDKGRAVDVLTNAYAATYSEGNIRTVGLGDSANDVPMLKAVDLPVAVRKKTGEWEHIEDIDAVVYSQEIGPAGWAEVILAILNPSPPPSKVGQDAVQS